MPRRDLPSRTRTQLTNLVEALAGAGTRLAVLGGGSLAVLVLHAVTGDSSIAWLAVPVVLLAGLAIRLRPAFLLAGGVVVGHALIDVLLVGVSPGALPGVLARTLVLPFLALVGSVGSDIERQRHRAMERAVTEDPVTGLLNVRVFYEEMAARRSAGEPFTILLADLRGMRNLNERYGHPTGTEAMRVLAYVLRRGAGPDALLARLGSDEIAVLVPGTDRDRCREVVGSAVRRLSSERVRLPEGREFEVHASYGIARFPEDGQDEVAVLRAADHVKERAKSLGGDPVGIAGTGTTLDGAAEGDGPSDRA